MRVLKNRRAPVTAQRCKGCHAEVPEAEQLVSTVGIICVDCDELFLEQGSSAPVPALPKCGRCKLGVWPGDEKLVAFVDKKTGQQRIFTVHATCP